jgi:hypothetical protein
MSVAKATFPETDHQSNKPATSGGRSSSDMRNAFSALFQGDLSPLRPRAQDTPDLTIKVNPTLVGLFFKQVWQGATAPLTFAGGNSPSVSAPSSHPRIDLLTIDSTGTLAWTAGAENSSPVAPDCPISKIPICYIYCKTTMTKIVNYEDKDTNPNEGYIYQDVRPFLNLGGGDTLSDGTFTVTAKEIAKSFINIMLAFFKISVLGGYAFYNLIDGFMDEFEDETGVDTGSCVNQSFSTKCYQPTGGLEVTISQLNANQSNRIGGGGAGTDAIFEKFKALTTEPIKKITVNLYRDANTAGTFTVYIYSDNGAGKPLSVLATFSNIAISSLTTSPVNYDFTGNFVPTANTIYHIVGIFTGFDSGYIGVSYYDAGGYADGAGGYRATPSMVWIYIGGDPIPCYYFKVWQEAPYDNMTLISNAFVVGAVPTKSRIVLFEEDVDAVTINTDIKAYMSRDNGTNWTQHTLTDEGDYGNGQRILASGAIDISGQPSGSNVKWKVTTHNNKNLKFHAVGSNWD